MSRRILTYATSSGDTGRVPDSSKKRRERQNRKQFAGAVGDGGISGLFFYMFSLYYTKYNEKQYKRGS